MLVFNVITDLILFLSILMFCKLIFGFVPRANAYDKLKIILTIMCVIGISIYINLWDCVIVEIFIYCMSVILFVYSFYEERKLLILLSSLWTTIIMAMFNAMTGVLFDMATNFTGVVYDGIIQLLRATFLLCFTLIIGGLYARSISRGMKTISISGILIFTWLTIADMFIVMVVSYFVKVNENLSGYNAYVLGFMIVIIGLFIQLGAVILFLLQRNIYKDSQQITIKYLEEQKNHYEYLEKRERETKKFRHDLRSHMEMLMTLVKERRYAELENYMDKININIDKFGNVVSVQNGIVDAIINKYYSEAGNQSIDMKVKGRFPRECEIEAYDLCTIFSNILSNAIEGATEVEKGWISIECRYTEDNMLVVVNNTFDYQNPLRRGIVGTYKRDLDYHGFGLENVREAIKKYNGVCDTKINGNVYSTRISLNYRSGKKYENSNN